MNVANGGAGTVSSGGLAYDQKNTDGDVFVLANNHRFVDGATLGDLYDAGGDFAVDVDTTHTESISDSARITLQNSLGARGVETDSNAPSRDVTLESASNPSPTLSDMVANVYSNVNAQDSGERREPTTTSSAKASSASTAASGATSGFHAAANAFTGGRTVVDSSDAEADAQPSRSVNSVTRG